MSSKGSFGFLIGGLLLGTVVTSAVFITKQKRQAVDLSHAVGTTLFSVDGTPYATGALPGDAEMGYYTLQNNIYNAQKEFATQIALRIALAKDAAKPISSDSLPKIEELLKSPAVTETEAKQTYDQILHQMGPSVFGGKSFEEIKPQLMARLSQQKDMQAITSKASEMEASGRIKVLLSKPEAPAVKLSLEGYPVRGNASASMTLVEVADYLCPHCRQVQPEIENIYKEFSKKVKFVQVSFPLNPTGLSGFLAKGAFCANQQGADAFWKFHERAFQVPFDKIHAPKGQNEQKAFQEETLRVATDAHLDTKAFEACLGSDAAQNYLKKVQSDFNSGNGFQGTPAFYLNNKMLDLSPQQMESSLRAALSK